MTTSTKGDVRTSKYANGRCQGITQETKQEYKSEQSAFSRSTQILFIVFYIQLIADIVVLVEVIIIDIHDAKASISFRNLQCIEQVPAWPSEIIRCTIQDKGLHVQSNW